MGQDMDRPTVDHLDLRTNSVDLAALGSDDLKTWITYPGIAVGDFVYLNWRGCAADGEVVDIFGPLEVRALDSQGRWMREISNATLQALSEGTVFYSYQRLDAGLNPVGDESQRRFFFVDRPPEASVSLPVAHLRDAHDLIIDVEPLPTSGVVVVAPPYAAMAAGDVVTLSWHPWYDPGWAGEVVTLEHQVLESDIGQPLRWRLEYSDVYQYFDGFAFLRYSIAYADGGSSRSPEQRYEIVWGEPSAEPLLPAPVVPGHSGGVLDPDDPAYQQGVWLLIDAYPGLAQGDSLVLYADGPDLTVRTLPADLSVIDSDRLAVHLDRAWLQSDANRGQQVTFSYQFGRPGAQKRSQALTVSLQRPLFLPLPIIRDARPEPGDEGYQGTVYPRDLQQGAVVNVPPEAVIDDGAIRLHWEGHGRTGHVIVDPPGSGNPREFRVPRSAMAANLGHRLWVYYAVTKPGQAPQASAKFDLRVADYEQASYPLIQLDGVENQQLSLAKVPIAGCRCLLGTWPFMAEGQFLGISAQGVPSAGKPGEWVVRSPDSEVTEDEYYDGRIEAWLPKAFLEGLVLNATFRVTVQASFDEGESWKDFRSVDITLIK